VEGDIFIGEAEPPFRRLFNIAPGPKHITSNQGGWDRMTKAKKEQKPNRIRQQVNEDMPVINRNAAGIEVGASEMWVSVPPDRDTDAIRRYDV
jgi:hypothetical protein